MKPKTPGNKKSVAKWLRRIVIALAIAFLAPAILFSIGWLRRDLLIDGLQEWYRTHNNGSLEIGEVNSTFLKGFPSVGFTINDIYQTSFDTILDKRSSIFIKEARVNISAKDLISGDLEFNNIRINRAKIHSEVISDKTVAEYIKLKKKEQARAQSGFELPGWLSSKKTNFSLREVIFISKDSMLNKYFNLEVKKITGQIRRNNETISGSLDFNILVNDLGFNTTKGNYINGALVSGNPSFELNEEKTQLSIPEFLLKIGSQDFTTKADFRFNQSDTYHFSLANSETDFQELKALLPDSISAKLSNYEILEPLDTKLKLNGEFKYGDVPYIDADFSTSNNKLKISKRMELNDLKFNGYLTNSLNMEEDQRNQKPGRKDIKVVFNDLSAKMEDFEISVVDSYFQSSEEALNFLNIRLKLSGSNESLANLIQTNNFDFIGGNFALDAHIEGNIPNAEEVIDHATGNFTLRDTRVVLQKNKLQLPVEIIDLTLNSKNWGLDKLKINLFNGEYLEFTGTVNNASSLLADDPRIPASADVKLNSRKLNINDLISTAMEFIPASEKPTNNLNTLRESFETFYKKLQPRLRLNLDAVEYNTIRFDNLLADIKLLNAETVQLNNLSFEYNDAFTELQGTLRVPEPDNTGQEPIFLNAKTQSSGPLKVFQDLFNIQLLDIKEGEFGFSGEVIGNIHEFEQLLNNVNGDLKLENAEFYYPKAEMGIHLDSLNVEVENSNIELKKFVVEVDEHRPFTLQSTINEFPGFLLDSMESKGKIFLQMDAEFINIEKWMQTIQTIESDSIQKKLNNRDLTAIFADIYKFDPELRIVIDSLKYKNLLSEDLAARVYFENDSIVKLEEFRIKYKNSEAYIKGELEAHKLLTLKPEESPFRFAISAEASGNSKDLNELLQTVNFNLRSGNFKFSGSYEGESKDLEILNSNARGDLSLGTTLIDVQGTEIQIPVDSLHLEIKNNLAQLKKLDVNLPGKSAIDITGEIDNFSNFINNEQKVDSHRSAFLIKSPYLDSKDVKKFIGNTERRKDSTKEQEFEIKNLKDILSNINRSYFPSAILEIDSLKYENLAVSDFSSKIGFNEMGAINITDTKLKYSGGSINLRLEADIENPEELPGSIKMDIKDIDLGKLIKDLDYFKSEDLRQAKKISGNLNLQIDLNGKFNAQDSLDMNSLNGTINLDLANLALYDFEPIIENVVLLREERFEQLQFRPISQTFKVINGKISIPRTQVQSSALQLFVEGETKIGEYYNIWISLPWNNILKRRDGLELPEKISFDESGAKVYLQIIQDKDSEKQREHQLKTKFRLSNRKLEKDRQN